MTPADRLTREIRRRRLRSGVIAVALLLAGVALFALLEPALLPPELVAVARLHDRAGGRATQVWATRPDGTQSVLTGLRQGETANIGDVFCVTPVRRIVPHRVTLAVTRRADCATPG